MAETDRTVLDWLRRKTRLGRRPWRKLALLAAGVAVAGLVAVWAVPLPARMRVPPSTVVTFADGSPAYVFLSPDDKYRMAADLGEIDPDYVEALLRYEDKRFYAHPGVDPVALLRSIAVNLRVGRTVTGASTLTMQLVRVLEPRPRTLRSKAIEALRAFQLELRMSKREILASYLSFISFGRNVEGVTAACWAYFGHGPEALAPEEIAILLAVPQRPASRNPSEANFARLMKARNEIAEWLLEEGALPLGEGDAEIGPAEVLAQVRGANLPIDFRPLPRSAAHAAFWLHKQQPGETRIETTLDRGSQLVAERLLRSVHGEMSYLGIHNGAAVVVDHRSSEVKALVGNFDFWDARHGGQIAGFDVPRSPGSALKPLIYALAVDRGLVLPEHLVTDVPVAYGDYRPDNYDGSFTGLISLEEALSFSLNVPFVRLLSSVGVDPFVGALRTMGAASLSPRSGYYGLSAAIGSAELTPLEMAALYATLAEDGRYRPLRWLREQEAGGTTQIFSAGSAFLTRRALARRDRPDFPERRRMSGAPSRIHWKTGTSYGHRDAWAAGSGDDMTAVVWLGNFDNSPSVDLVGAEAAGPVLFDLLEAVADRARPAVQKAPPGDLKKVEVCAYSGHLPTPACTERKHVWALRDRVPTRACPYHVELDVDLDTGLALNPGCRSGKRWETRSYLVWPATVRRFLAARHRWLASPPTLAPGCETTGAGKAPSILHPPKGQTLVLLPGLPTSDQEIPLQAEAISAGAQLSWFVDGEFLGTAQADERLWWTPSLGRHEILVVDEAGLTARRQLQVRLPG